MPRQSIANTSRPEYPVYNGMLARCRNPRNPSYHRYGGRGITVCERWSGPGGFVAFLSDMGERPTPEHTLDRINNDGPYSPENCRWATPKEQARNRMDNRILTHDGVSRTVAEWAEITGMDSCTIRNRLDLSGYSVERALTQPLLGGHKKSERRARRGPRPAATAAGGTFGVVTC